SWQISLKRQESKKPQAKRLTCGLRLVAYRCDLAFLGHVLAFEVDDTLAVVLDGLCSQHAALIILEVAFQLAGQLARRGHHQIEGLFGIARAGQAEEEADRTGA